ncbi:MAG: hypothetical protein ABIB61_03380 [Candidatus Shapirobacteria bacterium]
MKSAIYLLKHSLTGIGRAPYPQCRKMSPDYDKNAPDSVYKLNQIKFPNLKPNFNYLEVIDGATLTDLISCVPLNPSVLVVSNKLLKIFLGLKLPPYQIHSVILKQRGKKIGGYNAFQVIEQKEHLKQIDFKKSKFWLIEVISKKKLKQLNLNSAKEVMRADKESLNTKEVTQVWAEILAIKSGLYKDLDLFFSPTVVNPIGFYVNDKAKQALVENKCTGIDFTSVSHDKDSLVSYFGDRNITYIQLA